MVDPLEGFHNTFSVHSVSMDDAYRQKRLMDAVVAISSDLSLPTVLRSIVESACSLVGARYGALGVIGPGAGGLEKGLAQFITVGVDEADIAAIDHYPEGHGLLGLLITEPHPLRLPEIARHPKSFGFPKGHPVMHTFLGVPVRVRDDVFGNLYLAEKEGGQKFTSDDEELVVALAGAAGVAIENARLHEKVGELVLIEERERIARDLHDTVIQRLFATGMGLQGTSRLIDRPDVAARVTEAIEEIDATIREIRGAIFALQAHEKGGPSLRVAVLALAADATRTVGCEPRVHFDGPVDSALDAVVGEELLTTLREALSNVAKHAHATRVDVNVHVGSDVTLQVIDNGAGMPESPQFGQGISNMTARASSLGGTMTLTDTSSGGTTLTWRVPLHRH